LLEICPLLSFGVGKFSLTKFVGVDKLLDVDKFAECMFDVDKFDEGMFGLGKPEAIWLDVDEFPGSIFGVGKPEAI
jgi:hypothetical protein